MWRAITIGSLLIGFAMLLLWPWAIANRPDAEAPRADKERYLVRSTSYTIGLIAVFMLSAVGAVIVLRRARAEYREGTSENLKKLIAGLREDHESRKR